MSWPGRAVATLVVCLDGEVEQRHVSRAHDMMTTGNTHELLERDNEKRLLSLSVAIPLPTKSTKQSDIMPMVLALARAVCVNSALSVAIFPPSRALLRETQLELTDQSGGAIVDNKGGAQLEHEGNRRQEQSRLHLCKSLSGFCGGHRRKRSNGKQSTLGLPKNTTTHEYVRVDF